MAKCSFCGTDDAYIGFSEIECINYECQFYSPKQCEIYLHNLYNNLPAADIDGENLIEEPKDEDDSNSGPSSLFSANSLP